MDNSDYFDKYFKTNFKKALEKRFNGSIARFIAAFNEKYGTDYEKAGNSTNIKSLAYKWQDGTTKPSVANLAKICNVMDCDIDFFLTTQKVLRKSDDILSNDTGLSDEAIQLLKYWNTSKSDKTLPSDGFNDVSCLNDILEQYNNYRINASESGQLPAPSIFFFMWSYFNSDNFARSEMDRVRFKSGKRYTDLNIGDTVIGADGSTNVIEALSVSNSVDNSTDKGNNLYYYDTINPSHRRYFPFNDLMSEHMLHRLTDELKVIKDKINESNK
jgi:hypothetical protein